MKEYPFNTIMKIELTSYFKDMRFRVMHGHYSIFWSIQDQFNGYIRALCAAGVIDLELKDRLFDIANNMLRLYDDKGVC